MAPQTGRDGSDKMATRTVEYAPTATNDFRPMKSRQLYKVVFHNDGKVYEIFARQVYQGSLFGFVEIADIVFGEKSAVVVDPSEEKLKAEFDGVTRTHIPMHAVVRIDEVDKQGTAKITGGEKAGNIARFPTSLYTPGKAPETPKD